MTASATLRQDVLAGFFGHSRRGSLNTLLRNYKKSQDYQGVASSPQQSTKIFYDTRSIAASSSENLDLAGALVADDGSTLTFTKIHGIYVRGADANGGNIVVGGAASNTFTGPFADATDKVAAGAGDVVLLTNKSGWSVTAGTGDILKVANSDSGAAGVYDVVIIGE